MYGGNVEDALDRVLRVKPRVPVAPGGEYEGNAKESLLKYLGIPTTRESHFLVSQNTVTLAKTPN